MRICQGCAAAARIDGSCIEVMSSCLSGLPRMSLLQNQIQVFDPPTQIMPLPADNLELELRIVGEEALVDTSATSNLNYYKLQSSSNASLDNYSPARLKRGSNPRRCLDIILDLMWQVQVTHSELLSLTPTNLITSIRLSDLESRNCAGGGFRRGLSAGRSYNDSIEHVLEHDLWTRQRRSGCKMNKGRWGGSSPHCHRHTKTIPEGTKVGIYAQGHSASIQYPGHGEKTAAGVASFAEGAVFHGGGGSGGVGSGMEACGGEGSGGELGGGGGGVVRTDSDLYRRRPSTPAAGTPGGTFGDLCVITRMKPRTVSLTATPSLRAPNTTATGTPSTTSTSSTL